MGLPAYAETCPQYLFFSYDNYEEPGFDGAKYVMSPPLRERWHQDVLWKGLAKNDLQVISTDHCPFCMREQKELGRDDFSRIPNGAPGIETRMMLVHNGGVRQKRIGLNRFVELCSTTPARMFGLFPRKGTNAVGSDESRSSISSPSGMRVLMRPSCGRRFSTTSMRARILMREVIATSTG